MLKNFVRAGGGLLVCEYGVGWDWWWGRPKPDAIGNRLLRQAGITFVGGNRPEQGTLAIEPAAGRMAADDLLALLADPDAADAALRARAGVMMSRIFDGLAADDPLALRIDAAIGDAIEGVDRLRRQRRAVAVERPPPR